MAMARQLFVDLYGCDPALLNDMKKIQEIARTAVAALPAQIVEECCHVFEPIGITYIAVITTSHFSIHTWPEYGYAAVDVFSCQEDVPQQLVQQLQQAFGAKQCRTETFRRHLTQNEE